MNAGRANTQATPENGDQIIQHFLCFIANYYITYYIRTCIRNVSIHRLRLMFQINFNRR